MQLRIDFKRFMVSCFQNMSAWRILEDEKEREIFANSDSKAAYGANNVHQRLSLNTQFEFEQQFRDNK